MLFNLIIIVKCLAGSKPGPNGKDVPYGLRGVKGKLAIVDAPVNAGTNNKQLPHFWGGTPEKTEQLFNKQVKIIGTSKEDGKTVTAFEGSIGIPNEEIVKPPHHYSKEFEREACINCK